MPTFERPARFLREFRRLPRELSFAPDGRATFGYGEERVAGQPHVIWRRIGDHSIFRQP